MGEREECLLKPGAGDLDVLDFVPGQEQRPQGGVGIDAAQQGAVAVDLDGRHAGEGLQAGRGAAGEREADGPAPPPRP